MILQLDSVSDMVITKPVFFQQIGDIQKGVSPVYGATANSMGFSTFQLFYKIGD